MKRIFIILFLVISTINAEDWKPGSNATQCTNNCYNAYKKAFKRELLQDEKDACSSECQAYFARQR